jgi:hypothetical protein
MTKTRVVYLIAEDWIEMQKENLDWEVESFHYEALSPVADCRVILAARPHDSKYLKELAMLLGAHQVEDHRILLANGVVEQADELAFIVRNYLGGLGLIVLTRAIQKNE